MLQARRILRLKAEPLENLSIDQIHDKFIHEKLKMVIKIKRKREKEDVYLNHPGLDPVFMKI